MASRSIGGICPTGFAGRVLIALVGATQLVLAVRGTEPTTVIAYGLTTVCTAALLVRLFSQRGVG